VTGRLKRAIGRCPFYMTGKDRKVSFLHDWQA